MPRGRRPDNLTGVEFGRLTAIEPTAKRNAYGSVIWVCRCKCGNTGEYAASSLMRGFRLSCGCIHTFDEANARKIIKGIKRGLNQSAIAAELGVSRQRISELIKKLKADPRFALQFPDEPRKKGAGK